MLIVDDSIPVPQLILGPPFSSSVQLISTVSELSQVPVLTYSATSPYLSSKGDYPTIWRTCLTDELQTQAWAELCVAMKWKNAIVLVEATSYSQAAAQYFKNAGSRLGITVTTINIDNGASTLEPVIREALEKIRQTNVKIIFAPITTLMQELIATAIEERMFGPSSFVRRDQPETITIKQKYTSKGKAPTTYTITLPKNTRRGDPRVQGFVWNMADNLNALQSSFASSTQGTLGFMEPTLAVKNDFLRPEYEKYWDIAFSRIVELYRSLNVGLENFTISSSIDHQSSHQSRSAFNLGSGSNSLLISDPNALFEAAKTAIYSFYPASIARAVFLLFDINSAFYKANQRFPSALEMSSLMQAYNRTKSFGAVFQFNANQEYVLGQLSLINSRRTDYLHSSALWANRTGFKGLNPLSLLWPDGTRRVPDDGLVLENYIFKDYPLGIFIIITTATLLVAFVVTALGLYRFWSTPVFRLATPELLAMMLGGMFFVALSIGGNVGRPSPAICTLVTWPYYVGFTLIFSPLIMKTYRVHFIFHAANDLQRTSFSTKRLIVFTLTMASILVVLSSMRLIVSPPSDNRDFSHDATRVEVRCVVRYYSVVYAQLGVIAIQMIAAMFLSWKTRSVPDGFNESRNVFITTYMMCIVGMLGLVVSNLIDQTNSAVASGFQAFSSLILTASCWALIFAPKLYLAIRQPEKNTIQLIKLSSTNNRLSMADMPLTVYENEDESQYEAPEPTLK